MRRAKRTIFADAAKVRMMFGPDTIRDALRAYGFEIPSDASFAVVPKSHALPGEEPYAPGVAFEWNEDVIQRDDITPERTRG